MITYNIEKNPTRLNIFRLETSFFKNKGVIITFTAIIYINLE